MGSSPQLAGELLTCEHDPVYTFGLREKNLAIDEGKLKKLGAEVFKVTCVNACMHNAVHGNM